MTLEQAGSTQCRYENRGGGGWGGTEKRFHTVRFRPDVQPLTHFCIPFLYLLLTDNTPFTYLV